MNLRSLIGKKVIRTKPIEEKKVIKNYAALSDEVVKIPNYNFCDMDETTIEVIEVVQDVPILKITSKSGGVYFKSITGRYDDDNWKDVTEVYKRINEIRMNDFKERVIKCGDFFYSEKPHGVRLADCNSGLAGLDYFINPLRYMSKPKA